MKLFQFALCLLISLCAYAQSPPYRIFLSAGSPSATSGCYGYTSTITGQSRYQQWVSDPPGYDPCPNSTVTVRVRRWTGSSWVNVGSAFNTTTSNPNYSITFTPTESGTYQVFSSLNTPGAFCPGSVDPATNGSWSFTVNYPANANYQVNGNNVNASTYLQVCDGGAITMNNINHGGTNSSYQWRVGASRNGSPPSYLAWASGTPPSTFDLKSFLLTTFSLFPLTADYDVYLQTKNLCNSGSPHTYTGKVRIVSSDITIQFQTKNNSTGTPLSTVSGSTTCSAPHTSFCQLSTIVAANQSTVATLVNGLWSCSLGYIDVGSCGSMRTRNVFTKPEATLTNLNDLASMDLNAFAFTYGGEPFGYVTNESANKVWYFELTIKNQCNTGGVTAGCWLRNVNSGCKTDGATEVLDPASMIIDNNWTFYPNPANDKVTINWMGNYAAKADIRVFDLLGRNLNVPFDIIGESATLDVSNLAKGQYVLLLNGSGYDPRMLIVE